MKDFSVIMYANKVIIADKASEQINYLAIN